VSAMNPRPKPPMPGGECTFTTDTGPQPVPPGVKTVRLIAVGDGGPGPLLPRTQKRRKRKPVLPTPAEIAALPGGARAAFAARCALRVAPLVVLDATADDAAGAAALAILRIAPEPWALQFIRRDFERLRRLAKANAWTDDTPIPPEVFGPMWPEGRTPKWMRETNQPQN
jgi:hypothetical protein